MIEYTRTILTNQYEAALWMVAYHTLCFTDLYLSQSKEAFVMRAIHPAGWSEFDEEYPSRRFEKKEIAEYVKACVQKARQTFAAATKESLQGPAGFERRNFSRGELYIYNLRHVHHHTGQLSAFLRKIGADPKWIGSGWKELPR